MLISIIIPTYNSGSTLENALLSIFNQNRGDLEVIVIDGKSKDHTPDILAKYSHKIDYVLSEPDKCYADALNKGIKYASGKFIFMLAADDILLPNFINFFLKTVRSDTDVWCGSVLLKLPHGYLLRRSDPNLNKLYLSCTLENAATLYRRDLFNRFGFFDITYICASDREMFLRLHKENVVFQIESEPSVIFNIGGMSTRDPKIFVSEDLNLSLQYGLDQEIAHEQMKKVLKSISFQKKISLLKYCLHKAGILKFLYLAFKKNNYFSTSDIKKFTNLY